LEQDLDRPPLVHGGVEDTDEPEVAAEAGGAMVCIIDSWVPTASTTEYALSPLVSS
jgi:hypothetical protein